MLTTTKVIIGGTPEWVLYDMLVRMLMSMNESINQSIENPHNLIKILIE